LPKGKHLIWRGHITELGGAVLRGVMGVAIVFIIENAKGTAEFYGCVSGCPTIVQNESPSWPLPKTYY